MFADIITIFPDYFAPLDLSLIGKARAAGIVDWRVHDLRTWTHDRHHTVDDTPYGGGAGMVMKPEPWGEALDAVLGQAPTPDAVLTPAPSPNAGAPDWGVPGAVVPHSPAPDVTRPAPTLVVPTPSGEPFRQAIAHELAELPHLVFACGRYEGIDARVVEHARTRMPVREVSLGDYVLNGGEVAVLAIMEAIVRLLPGVVGNPESLVEESHSVDGEGWLEYPVYTKPLSWRGLEVPEVLLSGHHGRVAQWRREQSHERTARRRPDLLERPQADDLHNDESS